MVAFTRYFNQQTLFLSIILAIGEKIPMIMPFKNQSTCTMCIFIYPEQLGTT